MRWCVLLALVGCHGAVNAVDAGTVAGDFANPMRVTINGWNDNAMEPFVSRDGHSLYFNNSNDATVNTDLHWAERIDDLTFQYRGPVGGVNTTALEAVASDDNAGDFYFISNRSYAVDLSTIYRGQIAGGTVSGVAEVAGVAATMMGRVIFDVVIAPDGNTMAFAEGVFTATGGPTSANLVLATRSGTGFARAAPTVFGSVNLDGAIQYAPVFSASGLELYYTRVGASGPVILGSSRVTADAPFGPPRVLKAITGFAEAPTLSADEKSLYYHLKDGPLFAIYRVTRP